MNSAAPASRKGLLRLAAITGILSALLLVAGKPVLAANSAQEQVSRDFQKTVTLGAGQSVRVEHKFGEVRLHGESSRDVKSPQRYAHRPARMRRPRRSRRKYRSKFCNPAKAYASKTIYPEEERKWFHLSKNSSWSVSYDIGMPSDAPLTVRNSFGSIDAARIHGAADLENSHGSSRFAMPAPCA